MRLVSFWRKVCMILEEEEEEKEELCLESFWRRCDWSDSRKARSGTASLLMREQEEVPKTSIWKSRRR